MNRLALVLALAGSIMLTACDSPTAPTRAAAFPYAGCVMVQAGTDSDPQGHLEDVWHQWHCGDGRNWQVDGDGKVSRMGAIYTAAGKTYPDNGQP